MASIGNGRGGSEAVLANGQPSVERDAVLDQLHRMLAHPLFCNSKRYPGLLQHLVEHALAGKVEQLKERTLGVEVFHRTANYDTNLDPVVRITAGEIRKRIAQYYFLPGRESEIRIDLRPGSYIPEFYLPNRTPAPAAPLAVPSLREPQRQPQPEPQPEPLQPAVAAPSVRSHTVWPFVLAVLFLAAVVLAWQRPWASRSILKAFWQPVVSSPGSVLLCVSDQIDLPEALNDKSGRPAISDEQISMQQLERSMHRIGLPDAITLSRLTAVLQSMEKRYAVRGDKSTSLQDLRQGPVVLVGAFDNDWTTRLTRDLRYTFNASNLPENSIKDRLNPSQAGWSVDTSAPYLKVTKDYAIVARFRDQTSGSIVVVAAGLGAYGTLAAGEVLSNESYLQQIVSHAPRDWKTMNMEAVIETQVINDNSGPPKVLATYFW
jgi:hypothetical protein